MTPTNSPRPGSGRRVSVMVALIAAGTMAFTSAAPAMSHADMKDHDATNTQASPNLTATQALERMLTLIRGIHAVTDVTPELLQRTMGKDVHRIEDGRFGFGQRLPGNWAFSVERALVQPHDVPQLELGFDPIPDTDAAPLADCKPDYAAFTAALEGMSFVRHASYGEHGQWEYDVFDKPGLQVKVLPADAQPKDGAEARGTRCVHLVLVR